MPRIARIIAAGYPHHITQQQQSRHGILATTYPWSSAAANGSGKRNPILAEDSWLAPEERAGYGEFLDDIDEETDDSIRRATRSGRPFGTDQFIAQMEISLNQRLRPGAPGRPRKTGKDESIVSP